MIMRTVTPLEGEPRIRIVLRPTGGYGQEPAQTTRGSNHIRYVTPGITLRLTTDAPLAYVEDGTPFVLSRALHLILGPDETWRDPIARTVAEYEERTRQHWLEWVRGLSIPFEWQEAVIRAAITLQLCHFEETGAIVAALTTSIPEHPGSERNWDYRFCWLRDAYFVIHALNRLGATGTMENYLSYLTNLVAGAGPDGSLQPVYGIALEDALVERREPALAGYRGMGPVRVGNQAHEHIQNDVYGSAVLAATQAFFDARLLHPASDRLYAMLEVVGEQAVRVWDTPDAGLWELRTRASVHTFSAVMCWAACDRLSRIAARMGRRDRAGYWREQAERMRGEIERRATSHATLVDGAAPFAATFEGDEADASLLLLEQLGFARADDPRYLATIAAASRTTSAAATTCSATRSPTTSANPRPPSTSAPSGTSTRSPPSVGTTRLAPSSRTCSNAGTRSACCPRTSTSRAASSGETSRRPTRWSGLINSAMRLSRSWEDAF